MEEIYTKEEQTVSVHDQLERDGYSRTFSIPRALYALPLSENEKMIISNIVRLSSKYVDYGGCNLSNAELANRHNCSKTLVSNVISKAKWLGMEKSREDHIVNIRTHEGERPIQIRKIQMIIPDIWEFFGEVWGEFYFKGCDWANRFLRYLKVELNERYATRTEEIIDFKDLLEKIKSEFFPDTRTEMCKGVLQISKPPLQKSVIPPSEKFKAPFRKLYAIYIYEYNIPVVKTFTKDTFKNTLSDNKLSDGMCLNKNNNFDSNEEKQSPVNLKSKPTIKERNGIYIPLARQLANIIRSNKKIKITPNKINSWSNSIRILIENEDVSIERVQTVLNWYTNTIGEQYIPVVLSGSALKDKFIRLEDAMNRSLKEPKKVKYQSSSNMFENIPVQRGFDPQTGTFNN